jgi:hypothetical protein
MAGRVTSFGWSGPARTERSGYTRIGDWTLPTGERRERNVYISKC